MNPLVVETNQNGQKIVSRNGRLLCSPRDPEKESGEWIARQNLQESDKAIVVLGLGAGHHIFGLAKLLPETKIFIIELDMQLCEQNLQIQTELIHLLPNAENLQNFHYQAVLPFRPAWADMEKAYLKMFIELTQRSPESLIRAAELEGLVRTASAVAERRIAAIPFSLKDLKFENGINDGEAKIWNCLKELVD